jgi:uracil-DNA glycosylase
MEVCKNPIELITTNWKEVVKKYAIKDTKPILNIIQEEREKFNQLATVFPSPDNIFRCFNYFNVEDTRVVIIGQDPYHGKSQANGLCFSVNKNVKTPPSLRNIYKLLNKESDLTTWSQQGILMLNSALTVLEKNPGSHMKYWIKFTKNIIEYINNNTTNVIFVAWGSFALNLLENIDKEKHHVLVSSHPSPLSCNRPLNVYLPFIKSDIFTKINNLLETPIVW